MISRWLGILEPMSKPVPNPKDTLAFPNTPEELLADAPERDQDQEMVWNQFAELFELMEELATQPSAPAEFYERLLAELVGGFAADGARAWILDENLSHGAGAFQLLAQVGSSPAAEHLLAHEQMLSEMVTLLEARTKVIGQQAVTIVSVRSATKNRCHALIELVQRTDSPKELYHASEQLLETIAKIAADYHRERLHDSLHDEYQFLQKLFCLTQNVAGDLRLSPTSYRIVNETRSLLGADRVSLVRLKGRHPQLLAASGIDEIDIRSQSVKALKSFAKLVASDRRAMCWSASSTRDSIQNEFPEEWQSKLDYYADSSHVKSLIALPISALHQAEDSPSNNSLDEISDSRIEAVLIADCGLTIRNQRYLLSRCG